MLITFLLIALAHIKVTHIPIEKQSILKKFANFKLKRKLANANGNYYKNKFALRFNTDAGYQYIDLIDNDFLYDTVL